MTTHDSVDEGMFPRALNDPRQAELVAGACAELEAGIRTAPSEAAARQMAQRACGVFDASCESSLVKGHVRKHAENLLRRHWGT